MPALDSLRTYTLRDLRSDTLAGLTVAAVAVPQAMAYALVAGTGPEFGLYTAIVMTAVGALLDSSKQLINGPTNAIAIALLSALAPVPQEQKVAAAILMALLVGIIQTGITLWRLGDLTRYVSHAVIVGFLLGAAVLLVLDQVKNLLGLTRRRPRRGPVPRALLANDDRRRTGPLPPHLPLAWGPSGSCCCCGTRVTDCVSACRNSLLAMSVMALAVWGLDLESAGVAVIGTIPGRLPSFEVPLLDFRLDPGAGRQRLGHRASGPAGSHRYGQGDCRADRPEARHQPAMP